MVTVRNTTLGRNSVVTWAVTPTATIPRTEWFIQASPTPLIVEFGVRGLHRTVRLMIFCRGTKTKVKVTGSATITTTYNADGTTTTKEEPNDVYVRGVQIGGRDYVIDVARRPHGLSVVVTQCLGGHESHILLW